MPELNFKKTLTNTGVSVYVMEMPQVKTVAAGVLVKAGTRDEIWPQEAGLAHALEHMVFQGTKRFPTSKEVHEYIEEIGGDQNAWTMQEGTFFHARVPAEYKLRAFEFISEVVNNPLIPQEKIRTEMQNIVEEIRMGKDDPTSFLFTYVARPFLFGKHPASRSVLGTEESVSSFSRENFVAYRQRFYQPGNYVFVAVGKITLAEVKELFEKYFPEQAQPARIREALPVADSGARKTVYQKELEQVNLALEIPVELGEEKTERALSLFATMLGGGASFPLFQEVRDKLGLCYSIQSYLEKFFDAGVFGIYIGTDPKRYREAIAVTREIISRYKADAALLEKAKKMRLGSLDLRFEHTGSILHLAADNILVYGWPKGYKERREEIEKISIKDVTRAVDTYLKPENIREALLVPKSLQVKE